MSEREMREALRQVCDKLELEARADAKKRGRKLVYPLMVGAGLLVASCGDETSDPQPEYAAPTGTPTATSTGTAGGGGGGTPTATGSGGSGGTGATGGGNVGGAQMDYMAPDP